VTADGVRVAVKQLLGERQPVKVLVPELRLCRGIEHSTPRARRRRGDDQRPDAVRGRLRDRLGDPAADVVPGQDEGAERELVKKSHHAAA